MSKRNQQIRFCASRDGTRIAYAECGDGPTLLFAQHWVHHLEHDWDSPIWRPWLELLTRRHRVIRYDWRGCGLSDRDDIDLSLEKYIDDLSAVAEAAAGDRYVLMGMAPGARIAMPFLARHPQRVTRLVLYQPSTSGRGAIGRDSSEAEEERLRFQAMELGWQRNPLAYTRFFTSMYLPAASTQQVSAYGELLRATVTPKMAMALLMSFHLIDVRKFLTSVRCPTLVINNRGNAIVPFAEGRIVASAIKRASFVPLDSSNHILLHTEPAWEVLDSALDSFLPRTAATGTLAALTRLTPRELEVVELVAQGLNNGAIALGLGISERTARNYVSILLNKIGVSSRAEAIVRAREAGFGNDDQ